jgi:isopenicillin-N N-acyltransferase-like protein
VHILLRGLLDAPHLADAVQAVATSRRASSANFIVGSREGEIIEIESSPEDFWVDYAEKGWLAHTNHFITPLLMNRVSDKSKVMLPDSFQRLGRIRTLVAGSAGRIGFAECTEFMSDHRNFPDSICRHEDPRDPEGKQVASVYATVMDLTEGILWLSPSNPCRGGFEAYGPVPAATETNR